MILKLLPKLGRELPKKFAHPIGSIAIPFWPVLARVLAMAHISPKSAQLFSCYQRSLKGRRVHEGSHCREKKTNTNAYQKKNTTIRSSSGSVKPRWFHLPPQPSQCGKQSQLGSWEPFESRRVKMNANPAVHICQKFKRGLTTSNSSLNRLNRHFVLLDSSLSKAL